MPLLILILIGAAVGLGLWAPSRSHTAAVEVVSETRHEPIEVEILSAPSNDAWEERCSSRLAAAQSTYFALCQGEHCTKMFRPAAASLRRHAGANGGPGIVMQIRGYDGLDYVAGVDGTAIRILGHRADEGAYDAGEIEWFDLMGKSPRVVPMDGSTPSAMGTDFGTESHGAFILSNSVHGDARRSFANVFRPALDDCLKMRPSSRIVDPRP